jgi:hypothetical protein
MEEWKILNPNIEIRNKLEYQMTKFKTEAATMDVFVI